MIKKISTLLFIILCSSFSNANANSSDSLILCHDCSLAEVEQSIHSEYGRTSETFYLIKDIVKGEIYRYAMWYEPEMQLTILSPMSVSADEKAEFELLSEEYDYIRFISGENYVSGVDFTGYDAQRFSFFEQEIIDDYKENSNIMREIDFIFTSLLSGFTVGPVSFGAEIELDVILPGNTVVTLVLTGFKSGSYDSILTVKEYRDADGNTIPEPDLQNSTLTFRFTTVENFQRWAAYMAEAYNLDSSAIVITWVKDNELIPIITVTDIAGGDATATQPPPPPPGPDPVEEEP